VNRAKFLKPAQQIRSEQETAAWDACFCVAARWRRPGPSGQLSGRPAAPPVGLRGFKSAIDSRGAGSRQVSQASTLRSCSLQALQEKCAAEHAPARQARPEVNRTAAKNSRASSLQQEHEQPNRLLAFSAYFVLPTVRLRTSFTPHPASPGTKWRNTRCFGDRVCLQQFLPAAIVRRLPKTCPQAFGVALQRPPNRSWVLASRYAPPGQALTSDQLSGQRHRGNRPPAATGGRGDQNR